MKPITLGALWIVGGMALIAVSDNLVGQVAREIGLWQFHVLRSGLVLPVALALAWAAGRFARLWPHAPGAVALRTAFSTLSLLMYFAALPAVGIAQAAAGLFTSPIWVALVSALAFGERVGPRRLVGAGVGFAGVCLVLGVGAAPVRPMAAVAVAAGLMWGLSVIWTRRYCLGESAAALAVWQFVAFLGAGLAGLAALPWLGTALAGVEGAGFATLPWRVPGRETLGLVAFIGLAGIVATACLARGYMSGPPSIVALFDFSFLFWAPFFAWVLWAETVTPRIGLGMALILVAGALAVWSGERAAAGAAPGPGRSAARGR
jgi:drug/metabolite transporter (DMT)-like permease